MEACSYAVLIYNYILAYVVLFNRVLTITADLVGGFSVLLPPQNIEMSFRANYMRNLQSARVTQRR